MKRLIPIFCVALIITCCLAVPVSAVPSDFYSINWLDYTTLNDLGENYLNLSAAGYEFYYALPFKERLYETEMLFKLTGTTNRVTSLTVVDEDDQVYEAQVLYLGSGFYRALFDCRGNGVETLTFNFVLNTTAQTSISVNQLRSSASEFLYFSPKYDAHVVTTENDQNLSTPFLNVNTFDTIDADLTSDGFFYVRIDMSDWKKYDFIDFTFSVEAHNVTSVYGVVNNKVSFPIEVQEIYSSTSEDYDIWTTFTVSCDLRNVPREGLLSIGIRGSVPYSHEWVDDFIFSCLSCTGYISSDSFTNPLYYWLMKISSNVDSVSGIMGNVSNSINSFKQTYITGVNDIIGHMGEFLDGVVTYINNLIRTIQQQFANLGNFLSNLFNPPGSLDAPADLQDSLADQAGELEGISDSLNSVDKVAADDINMDLDTFVDPNDFALATSGLSSILGSQFILQAFMIICTFALVGYILYGKR